MWSRNNQWSCNRSAGKIWQQSTQMLWVWIQLLTSAVIVHSWITGGFLFVFCECKMGKKFIWALYMSNFIPRTMTV